jgi:hypothetical protein
VSEMVERVARALCVRHGNDPDRLYVDRLGHTRDYPWWQSYVDDARAAIEAMREPTEAMEEAGEDLVEWDSDDCSGASFALYREGDAAKFYTAMIDAALK